MRKIIFVLAAVVVAAVAVAQIVKPPAPPKTFASAAEIAALLAKAKSEHKDGQPTVFEPVLSLNPYGANMEYRTGVGPAAVHEKEAELFVVLDGSGVLTTGGKLVKERRSNGENLTGTGIEGGQTQPVAKGDMLIVPENTPHWFSTINGSLVVVSMHVPRQAGAKP